MSAFHPDDIAFARQVVDAVDTNRLARTALLASAPAALCLHAGNLPYVGWHDVVSVVSAGYRYIGKLSRKDPYLGEWIREWMPDARLSTDLNEFRGLRADVVLFSGSETSVGPVMDRLKELDAVRSDTRFLIRTAHTSMAWVDSLDRETMGSLADAMARFDGNGCRSVRYVYSPFAFHEAVPVVEAAASAFSDRAMPARNRYREAYYRAVGAMTVRVGRLIVTDADPLWDDDGLVIWRRAPLDAMVAHAGRLGAGLQQLYHTRQVMTGGRWEALAEAQRPGVGWMPDGRDTRAFLRSSR